MKWRNISEEEVEAVLEEPDTLAATERGRINVFKQMGGRYVKVTYKELPEEILIISVVDKQD